MYLSHVLRWKLERTPNGELRVEPLIARFDGDHDTFADKAESIRILEECLKGLRETPEPMISQDAIDSLPAIGSKVWAVKEWSDGSKEALEVTVTEYSIRDSILCVVFGFYYKPYNEIWTTRDGAEAFMRRA
jgi:hypothetical protein